MKTLLFKESIELSVFIIVLMIICKNYNVVFISCLLSLCVLIYLFRVPKRELPNLDASYILAPCDGTILSIEESTNDMIKISIQIHITNVHTQWYPIDGVIRKTIYKKGSFSMTDFFSTSEKNEKITTLIQHENGIIRLDQIAGKFGQRIVNWSKQNSNIKRGQLMGMIKFSSQVDMFLPSYKVNLLLNENDNVIGKITPIAKWLF
jgi:phosphatidylserine decarboxylase